jgi:hypothetical protein
MVRHLCGMAAPGALRATSPLTSFYWLQLAEARRANKEPMAAALEDLEMSIITGPNEEYMITQRGLFGIWQWEALPPDIQRLEHPHRSDLENHVHRTLRMGRRRSRNLRVGISRFWPRADVGDCHLPCCKKCRGRILKALSLVAMRRRQ